MKRQIRMLCLLAAAVLTMASCLSDSDNSSTPYPDTAITSFTLGKMNRYVQSTSTRTGKDTLLKLTYTGSLYPMTIDHVGRRIYNETELPVGTDAKHVVCTISTKNSGVVFLKNAKNDSLYYHQATDSVDLSVPRVFRVFSVDGSGSRDYTVTLSVSSSTGTTFGWVKRGSIGAVDNFGQKRLVAVADTVVLTDAGVIASSGRAYRLADGVLQWSEDLKEWHAIESSGLVPKRLIGASAHELYGFDADGRLICSADEGVSWREEQRDEPLVPLPTENVSIADWPYAPADGTDYVLMIGNDPQDSSRMSIWRKISAYASGAQAKWVLMTQDDLNLQKLPRIEQLSLALYDNTVLAVGDGRLIYQSTDQGITWQKPAWLALPTTATGTAAKMATDEAGRLWLVTETGELWQGAKR